jgi:hypothetical protein
MEFFCEPCNRMHSHYELHYHEVCTLCLYNDAYEVFFDTENKTLNPKCFNPIAVCHDCLISEVYCCDTELKYALNKEFKRCVAVNTIQKWWKNIIYNINTEFGKQFIYKIRIGQWN